MAHQIESNYAVYAGKPAWHKLGTVLTEIKSVQEAWQHAYPFTCLEVPIFAEIGGVKDAITRKKAIYRSDGKLLGVVGNDYKLLQPIEAMSSAFDPLLKSGLVSLESAGSLFGGTRLWALGSIKNAISDITPNDAIKAYFLMYTSFDGSLAHGLQFTATRVVCNNTLSAAVSAAGNDNSYRFKHTASLPRNIESAMAQVNLATKKFEATTEAYKSLVRKQMTRRQQETYISNVISDNQAADDQSAKMETKVRFVIDLLDSDTNKLPVMRGTAWQAYNAVTEFITHSQGRTDDTRLNNQWFGAASHLNDKALSLALAQ
jgi:phage/plasmid-like protein (TIGR03299 family)